MKLLTAFNKPGLPPQKKTQQPPQPRHQCVQSKGPEHRHCSAHHAYIFCRAWGIAPTHPGFQQSEDIHAVPMRTPRATDFRFSPWVPPKKKWMTNLEPSKFVGNDMLIKPTVATLSYH